MMDQQREAELQPSEIMASEMVLRMAVTSLQPCMKLFGLVPSRVYFFIKTQEMDSGGQHQEKYPSQQMMRSVVRQEKDELKVAVLSFIQMLLSADESRFVLTSFMQALFDANSDQQLVANPGLWRVHDVIRLACAYMPLQQSLQNFISEGQVNKVNLEGVIKQLNTQHGLLMPEHIPHVLEAEEEEGPVAAVVRILDFVYATHVNRLAEDYKNFLNEQVPAGATLEPGVREELQWLKMLVDSIEKNGGAGFSDTVPQSVFLVETWTAVYDQLAYGGRGRALRDNESSSEAGESEASEATMINELDNDEEIGAVAGRAHHVININPRNKSRDQKHQELCRNLEVQVEQESSYERTRTYICNLGKNRISNPSKEIPLAEVFSHKYQLFGADTAAVYVPDADETCSLSSISSGTTDNNFSLIQRVNPTQIEACDQIWGTRQSRSTAMADGQIKLRDYQEELLRMISEGKNVAIFLPTGTGKTFIIIKYVQDHFSKPGINRVMFLAPKVKLAEQQFNRFRDFFPNVTYFRCGKTRSSKSPFSELLDTFKVFVLTPQCLVEAIGRKEVKMTDFSLLVLDECHHLGRGKHAYTVLMNLYMNAKFDPDIKTASLPQVIGLTASPGIGTGGTLFSATTYIQEICYSMDIEKICTVKQHSKELERYVNEPNHEIHTCQKRKRDGFKKIVEELMKIIEDLMLDSPSEEQYWTQEHKTRLAKILAVPNLHRGSLVYYQWLSSLENKLVEFSEFKTMYQKLFSMIEILVVYQKCLTLNEDCQSQYALDFLLEKFKNQEDQVPRDQQNSTERQLLDHFYQRLPELKEACDDPEDFNPKLVMLQDILSTIMEENQEDCACMVFVRTLELTKALQKWVQEHPQLRQLNPGRLTGNHKHTIGGMTRQELSDVVHKFNVGDHKLVICTSAAEEGLDFQACSVVVRYDYVTSMISMIQTRGRARRMDSQYCVLGTLTQGNVNKERENVAAERLMKQAVDKVQENMDANQNAYLDNMRKWQIRNWEDCKQAEAIALVKRKAKLTCTTPYQLLCRKCQEPACMSTDFRLIDQSHRAVVAESFHGRWKRIEIKEPFQFTHNVEKVAKVHCQGCSYDWGILARYIPTNRLLPMLKIESFFLVNTKDNQKLTKKLKWSDVPFEVEEFSDAEILGL